MIKKFLQKVFSKREKAAIAINQADAGTTSSANVIAVKHHQKKFMNILAVIYPL